MPKRASQTIAKSISPEIKKKKISDDPESSFLSEKVYDSLNKEFSQSWAFEQWPKKEFGAVYAITTTLDADNPLECLKADFGLVFVGPFDSYHRIVKGEELIVSSDRLAHNRFYHDTPQMITVLRYSDPNSGFHICYFRNYPFVSPSFVCSNDSTKSGKFIIIGTNLVSGLINHLKSFESTNNRKKIISKLESLDDNASFNEKKFRQTWLKSCDAQIINNLGIEADPRELIVMRELVVSQKSLINTLHSICAAKDQASKNKAFSGLDNLVTNANVSNDECDFGQSIELAYNLLSYHHENNPTAADCFNGTINSLLEMAFMLGNVPAFQETVVKHFSAGRPLVPPFQMMK
ncbi:hypothetical protein Ciccas_006597 [Cichlidogyrus casuarinus]|uniref:Uncharacterized protein n=1 Tax=Cichlidogyrus casuarinus TaxID=1844966 RepID=A0ABD2Q5C2_9PLAT